MLKHIQEAPNISEEDKVRKRKKLNRLRRLIKIKTKEKERKDG